MAEAEQHPPDQRETCGCFNAPYRFLTVIQELGMDDQFAEVSLLTCSVCGKNWLRFFYELEAFTASGRWYLGAIDAQQAANLTTANAQETLENLGWYFYGGSYYGGKSGKASGKILLDW
jgi:hypothetical protein